MNLMHETQTPTRNQPAWLLPALVGVLVALAALVAVVLTSGVPGAAPAPAAAPAPVVEAPPITGQEDLPMTHGSLDPNGPPVAEINVADARARFDAGTAVFVDMRAGTEFAAGHIPGALTITSVDLDSRLRSLPPGAVIIAYGDADRPESGRRGAQIFMELGYPEVIALEGGFQSWQAGGNPVE
jgi:rhodanese-related sulfurtransferase